MSDIGDMRERGEDGPEFEFPKPPEGLTLEELGELILNGATEEQDKAVSMLCDALDSEMRPREKDRLNEFAGGILRRKQARWKTSPQNP